MRLWRAVCGQQPQYSERNRPPTQLNGHFPECEHQDWRLESGAKVPALVRAEVSYGQTFAFGKCRPRRSPEIAESGNRACTQLEQVISNGETRCDALEQRLAQAPVIAASTITLEGYANGAPHPEASAYARMFSGQI